MYAVPLPVGIENRRKKPQLLLTMVFDELLNGFIWYGDEKYAELYLMTCDISCVLSSWEFVLPVCAFIPDWKALKQGLSTFKRHKIIEPQQFHKTTMMLEILYPAGQKWGICRKRNMNICL